jgi:hypothetical protein
MKGYENGIPSTDFPDDHNLLILGHELGNVLNGLLGMAELLGDSGLTVEQGRWLRAIEVSGKQMKSLIRSVCCFDAPGQPGIIPHCERVDGIDLLEQVVISHTPAARSRNNHLFLIAEPKLSRYWRVDACLVRQLLDNLVGNAIKFTRSGEIVIGAEPVLVDGNPEQAIRLIVSDTGPGIDGVATEHIFGAYHRCTDTGKESTGNRGLGLYICRSIAMAMGGQITSTTAEGGGARFEVVLPGALSIEEPGRTMLRSTLLELVQCQLRLGTVLRRSVANFLARLGVKYSDREVSPPVDGFVLLISEAPGQWSRESLSLLFTPHPGCSVAPQRKILEAPLLESTIGAVLLETALEWRNLVLRNENPGSIPKLR